MSVVVMTGASLRYYLYYDGEHDHFLWLMHNVMWGQNLFVFLISLIADTWFTRQMYVRSSFAADMVYWVGMPIYIVWALAYHSFDRDGKHDDVYFYGWISFWLSYTVAMQSYAKNSLAGLNNYMNIKIVEDLQPDEPEDADEEGDESEDEQP